MLAGTSSFQEQLLMVAFPVYSWYCQQQHLVHSIGGRASSTDDSTAAFGERIASELPRQSLIESLTMLIFTSFENI